MHSLVAHQPEQPVCNEDKIGFVGVLIPENGVHAPYLKVGGNDLQAVVHPAQVWLLQLHTDVLCDQVDCYDVLIPASMQQH